ncbi:Zinc finger protein 830 [Triplophysa tibetana]|uniref:Zinc finger protein 830 n=1 Tax=Triplophysa tibetana TaxID=1572043 RepID=A0A5A9PG31_9TELE|nr:Zinc finger protein 830 [Triplophysa tibetana]
MASVKKGKKVVNQEELRRLMRAKTTSAERQKRVDSPYAKYNSAGQLSCALCNAPIKSALLWQTHVLGKQHRDKAAEVKSRDQTAQTSTSSSAAALKRKAKPELATAPAKQAKHHNTAGAASGHQVSSNQSAGLGILAGNYDDGEGDMDRAERIQLKTQLLIFLQISSTAAGGASQPQVPVTPAPYPKPLMMKKLCRRGKTKPPKLYQKIDEIDEQIQCYRRVELLRAKQEVVKEALVKKRKDQRNQTQSSASDEEDEEELMHVLTQDWRAKGALA